MVGTPPERVNATWEVKKMDGGIRVRMIGPDGSRLPSVDMAALAGRPFLD